jgi:hypothetical protein
VESATPDVASRKSVDRPAQIGVLVLGPQRQQLAQRGLVDLDDRDARGLQVDGLVADRQRHLCGRVGQRLVVTDERPRQDRHGTVSMPA